ncbi:unnamed protein product, partial [Effrenium voratum]
MWLSQRKESDVYDRVSLAQLRREYTSDTEKAFLENLIASSQEGVPHPQAPDDPEMRLYR